MIEEVKCNSGSGSETLENDVTISLAALHVLKLRDVEQWVYCIDKLGALYHCSSMHLSLTSAGGESSPTVDELFLAKSPVQVLSTQQTQASQPDCVSQSTIIVTFDVNVMKNTIFY